MVILMDGITKGMNMQNIVQQLAFARNPADAADLAPVRPSSESVARFEQLLNVPGASPRPEAVQAIGRSEPAQMIQTSFSPTSSNHVESLTLSHVRHYAEDLSNRWDATQKMVDRVIHADNISPRELLSVQQALTNGTIVFDVTTKAAGMIEQDMQTLIQRS
jgi:hypothetical protein